MKHADYPGILPQTQSQTQGEVVASVRGTVVSGLTEGDLWRLDIFEGSQYERRRVAVKVLRDEVGEGETVDEGTAVDSVASKGANSARLFVKSTITWIHLLALSFARNWSNTSFV